MICRLIFKLLKDLISFDTSINPEERLFPSDECAKYVKTYGIEHGFEVIEINDCYYQNSKTSEKHEIYPIILLKRGIDSLHPIILFLGHLDVVPVTEAEKKEWVNNPFDAVEKGDKIYGRGAADMKGGNTAMLLAFENLQPKKGTVIIAFSGDEEIGGTASMPAIINALKEQTLLPAFVVNGEPNYQPILVTKRRGITQIKVETHEKTSTASGVLKAKTFKSIQGDGSTSLHSATYILGADIHAMFAAAKFSVDKKVVSVFSTSKKDNSVPTEVTIKYIDNEGAEASKIIYSETLSKLMWKLSSLPTLSWPVAPSKYGISIAPNNITYDSQHKVYSLRFDIRAMLKDKNGHEIIKELIYQHFSALIPDVKCQITFKADPMNVDESHHYVQSLRMIAEQHGMKILAVGEKLGGASDTRYFTNMGIIGAELGPIGGNSHGINEWVSKKSLKSLTKIYQSIFLKITQD